MKNLRRDDNNDADDKPVHEGSYACPAMQQLFDVQIPEADKIMAGLKKQLNSAATISSGLNLPDDSSSGDQAISDKARNPEEDTAGSITNADAELKFPKRKIALFVAFIGEAYCGMQINKEQRTIQAELEFALYKAGMLSQANFGHMHKHGWSNSARTDKGVHSCAQVCSVKINCPTLDMEKLRSIINSHLPSDICILDAVKVTRNFCAKTQRDKVRYQYMLPSFLLQNSSQVRSLFEAQGCHKDGCSLNDALSDEELNALRPSMISYRATTENLLELGRALAMFEGTHSFHNYTSGKKSTDPSSNRYILSFQVQDPVLGPDGIEWIPMQVVGQSFLLNQIRKMVSMAADATRGSASTKIITDSLSCDQMMRVGIAPAQGLFLDMSFFDRYNERHGKTNDPLDWATEGSDAWKRWTNFKENHTMQHIMKEETRQGNFLKYLFVQEFKFQKQYYPNVNSTPSDAVEKE
mmetsp:Transcript_16752/g.30447  ORF Transcript_16752/g.30447 Transcript_16752/m.30447 type:complete len:467 (-) Transcript_16752:230-1630(-)